VCQAPECLASANLRNFVDNARCAFIKEWSGCLVFTFFRKNPPKTLRKRKKRSNFASANEKSGAAREGRSRNSLGYGVMVTQQILVLFFLVRVRVSQHQAAPENRFRFSGAVVL
jgi:hypothetical protein